MPLIGHIDCFGLTDRGRKRTVNEDQFLIADLRKSVVPVQTTLPETPHARLAHESGAQLLAVADGLGGMGYGDQASRIAIDTLQERFADLRSDEHVESDLERDLVRLMEDCQERIQHESSANPAARRMATTLTMAYVAGTSLTVAHAGDSRCYLARGRELRQLTRDHTVAQQMIDRGVLTPERARGSDWNRMLWNVLGGGSRRLEPETIRFDLLPDDLVLLCTDGLTAHVPDARILEILSSRDSPEDACRKLVDEANAAGGSDNITVIVARVLREARKAAAA